MALILCIDTAAEIASVCISNNGIVMASLVHNNQKNHASFLQPAIRDMMKSLSVSFSDIDAVAVVNGPGSYTGLRIGLTSAKGIAYAAGKPLILLNTLEVMASAAIEELGDKSVLYCPVIDARRNEVFAALYTFSLHPVMPPQPLIIEADSFTTISLEQKIVFFGSGHNKCEKILMRGNIMFFNFTYSVSQISKLAHQHYVLQRFADVAYAQPFYTKDFFTSFI